MKTAMQELIQKLKAKGGGMDIYLNANTEIINEALAKEKEQIIFFCWECLRGDNIHIITSNKELIEYINDKYNQTYNQNK
jgi:hypothetical protein